jgi:hypothetical protein
MIAVFRPIIEPGNSRMEAEVLVTQLNCLDREITVTKYVARMMDD